MMNACIPRLISTCIYLPQKKHHYICRTHSNRMRISRSYILILSIPNVCHTRQQYRFRLQSPINYQINHPKYRNPKIQKWRSKNQWYHQYSDFDRDTLVKLFGIYYLRKTRYQLISNHHSITCAFKWTNDAHGL